MTDYQVGDRVTFAPDPLGTAREQGTITRIYSVSRPFAHVLFDGGRTARLVLLCDLRRIAPDA